MDIITPIFDICFKCWDRSAKYRLPIKGLLRSLRNLTAERDRLIAVHADVKERVDKEQVELHQVQTAEVTSWRESVEVICKEVNVILTKGEEAVQKNCLGGHCPTNCRSRYKLANEADVVKESVTNLVGIGHGFKDVEVTFKPHEPPPSIVGPQEPTVGVDAMFDTVREWVEDEAVRSISLFGAGGVGKTTLLKRVYNHFVRVNPNNHFVLWVVVSQPASIEQIQKKIWKQLKFSNEDWEAIDEGERAIKMRNYLHQKKFMLFLDDLWKFINLAEVGIPHYPEPCNFSKVIFSTRQEEVCGRMQVGTSLESNRRMKVKCLAPEDALRLFREKVGEETWTANPQIPKYAETVVKECQFLPLALNTVAKAMVFKKQPRQWVEAVKDLRSNLAKFQGMEEEVLKILKFSFDALPDETHKKCFLYCSFFPEDFEIGKYDLMDLLIGEGYFDECGNIHKARSYCEDVLDKLTTSCLLEEIPYDIELRLGCSFDFYKMHDVVREMALWVAREQYEKNILVLQEDQGTIKLDELKRLKDADMISMMREGTRIQKITKPSTYCLNLSTLILRNTDVKSFPIGFFSSMRSLKVLDLKKNLFLYQLAGDIGKLTILQYLNIQDTGIMELPKEFEKLVSLKYLFVNIAMKIDGVHEKILSSIIPSLLVFDNFDGRLKGQQVEEFLQRVKVEDSEVSLSLSSASEIKNIWTCERLQSCLRYLKLIECDGLASISLEGPSAKRMKQFELLFLKECLDLKEISILSLVFPIQDCFHNLRRVFLDECPKLLHLTSLILYAPNLDTLSVSDCQTMTGVVKMDDVIPESQAANSAILSCLRVLLLDNLPLLTIICGSPLPFPSLEWMYCYDCNLLCKLPFSCVDGNQFNKLKKIEGEEEWWNRLEWDDDVATQHLLVPKFVPLWNTTSRIETISAEI